MIFHINCLLASGWIYCAYLFVSCTTLRARRCCVRAEPDVSAQHAEVEEKGVGVPQSPEWGASSQRGSQLWASLGPRSSCPPAQELASSHLEPGLVRCVQRKDRRQGASSCCRPLFPWGVQVSPDPGAAAWTQCRPQAPVMFAAVRADAWERLCPQEERQEAHRPPRGVLPSACSRRRCFRAQALQASLRALHWEPAGRSPPLCTEPGPLPARPQLWAFTLLTRGLSPLPWTRAAPVCQGLRDLPPSGLYPHGRRWL